MPRSTKDLNNHVFRTIETMDEKSQKNDEDDMTYKIAIDISIIDDIYDIQLKLNTEVHEKSVFYISEDFLAKQIEVSVVEY